MKIKNKKFFLILFFSCLLISFLLINFSFAKELEIQYPGPGAPTTTKTLLPDYIRYVFELSLMIAGLVAFAALVYGGFGYLTSAGNPSKLDDAKDQVLAAILGLIILLSSFLILNTINPQLVILQMPGIPIDKGVILYAGDVNVCNQEKANPMGKRGEAFEKFPKSSRTLWDLNDKVKSIYFYQGSDELKVKLYLEEDYYGTTEPFDTQSATNCLPVNDPAKSIKFEWTIPGIHLYSEKKYNGDEMIYTSDRNTLPDFDDKAASIKFVAIDLRAVLHEDKNREGSCGIFLDKNPDLENIKNITGHTVNGASSMTVFNHTATTTCTVTLYTETEYGEDWLKFKLLGNKTVEISSNKISSILKPGYHDKYYRFNIDDINGSKYGEFFNDKIKSIKIGGECDVVLFGDPGFKDQCEVYKDDDTDMSNNYSNTCHVDRLDWCNATKSCPCTSSLIILPTK